MQDWHNMTGDEACRYWQSKPEYGLSPTIIAKRQNQFGSNNLRQKKGISLPTILLSQFKDFMVIVLLAAAILSGFLQQWDDAITIMAIVVINAFLGFMQEYKAERSLRALKQLSAPMAKCRRQGELMIIPAAELVPGDIIELESGDRIPADARLLSVFNLECDEAALTGESVPRSKFANIIDTADIQLGDRRNMIYAGTTVTRGKGLAIVVATGMRTQIGQIAGMLEGVASEPTPLQQRLTHLGRWLVAVCLLICLVVVVLGIWRGEPVFNMIMAGISLAVAAIPEGLPAIVTVALALGVQRMIRRRAVVRKLPAVETLGCATVVCSDKTGTLTKNEMTVKEIFVNRRVITVTGDGYVPQGTFWYGDNRVPKNEKHLTQALTIAALCNNCLLKGEGRAGKNHLVNVFSGKKWTILGDPTEGALLTVAAKAGIWRGKLEEQLPRVYEIPFEAERKLMTTVHSLGEGKGFLLCTKGAPDRILDLATDVYQDGMIKKLHREDKVEIQRAITTMAGRALRVLAVAMGTSQEYPDLVEDKYLAEGLTFVGLLGMLDPPRREVPKAIKSCHNAGIKVVMVTGDHPDTAAVIAQELEILQAGDKIMTGQQLDNISQIELERTVNGISVYARVSPRHKLRIVRALKKQGHIVAMTGDGVNDAPAVKEADIGIAMGISGTDVTKEASAMIIQDDDFSTIVAAIEEGRNIYDNIRKFIRYLLACNTGEVMTMFIAALLKLPLPLIPIQILWVNLITDGLPALALGMEPPEVGIMKRAPRHPDEGIFSRGLTGLIVGRGFQIALCTLLAFLLGTYSAAGNITLARTMAFTTLVMLQLVYVFECRSETESGLILRGNCYLIAAVLISVFLQLLVLYYPPFNANFQTLPLNYRNWIIIIAIVLLPTLIQLFFPLRKRKESLSER